MLGVEKNAPVVYYYGYPQDLTFNKAKDEIFVHKKQHSKEQSSKEQFLYGVKSALPIVLGYLPLGLAFGVLARTNGLSVSEVAAMSLLIYSGSGQFIAVGMLGTGAAVASIIATIFLVNSRYLLISASLAPYMRKISAPLLSLLAQWVTDETYAVGLNHLQENGTNRSYILGLFITAHLAWFSSSVVGAVLGNFVADTAKYGFNFALTAMFICLLIMQIKNNLMVWIAILAGILSVAVNTFWQGSWNIILATVTAATVGVMAERWKKQSS